MLIRALLLCACVLATLPASARASEGYDPVSVRLVGRPVVAVAGQSMTGVVRIELDQTGEVSGVRLEGAGWDVRIASPPAASVRVAKGGTLDLTFLGTPADPAAPITLRFRAFDRDYAVPLRLSAQAVAAAVTPRPTRPAPAGARRAPDSAARIAGVAAAMPPPADEAVTPAVPDRPVAESRLPDGAQASRDITVEGAFVYERLDGLVRGVDAMTVLVYDEDGGLDQLLGAGLTDTQGNFSFTVHWIDTEANPDLYLMFFTINDQITVVTGDEYQAIYAWTSDPVWDFTGTYRDWGALIPGDDDWNPALHILTNFIRDYRWYQDRACPPAPVTVHWPVEGKKGSTNDNGIYFGPNNWGWGEHTYGHEYGHWWQKSYYDLGGFTYCNGMGDPADTTQAGCTHWAWCWEHQPVPMMEGFVNWVGNAQVRYNVTAYGDTALFSYNWEGLRVCNETQALSEFPASTDGFISALMTDLWDTNNEDDPLSAGTWRDRLSLPQMNVLDCIRLDQPYTPLEFLDHFRMRNQAYTEQIWETAKNCMIDPDNVPPGRVTDLHSPTHAISVGTSDATVRMVWDRAPDGWSGVDAYLVSTTHTPALPGAGTQIGNVTVYNTPALTAGTWYFNIRSRDRAGNWSQQGESYGPIVILPPEPTDLMPVTFIDWDYPVVPRPDHDIHSGVVPAPTEALPGNATSTYLNAIVRNDGDIDTPSASTSRCYVDGDSMRSVAVGIVPAVSQWSFKNEGPMYVRGGRHTFEVRHDDDDEVWEDDEANNDWAKQWIWSPLALVPSSPVTRPAPPAALGGWDAIPLPSTRYYNCDGLHFTYRFPYPAFHAVSVHPIDPDEDYDCRLHFPTAAADTGFGANRAFSARPAGCVDAVIVNHANVPDPHNWDVGVLSLLGGTSGYSAEYSTGVVLHVGDSVTVTLGADDMMALRAFDPGADTGYVSISARLVSGSGPLHLAWYDRTFTLGRLDDHDGYALVDGPDRVRIDTYLDAAGWNGIALYRDPKDGTKPVTVVLEIGDTPCDLEPYARSGWYAPIVPRPAMDVTLLSVPLPDTLYGDVASTWLNYGLINRGMHPLPAPAPIGVQRDGIWMMGVLGDVLSAGSRQLENDPAVHTVPAGRHTLGFILDGAQTIEELEETDNVYGEQYVWGPRALSSRVPVTRAAPPERTGGWDDITEAPDGIYYDCDGLRTPTFNGGTAPHGYWGGIAVMPGDTSNVDLRLHEIARGAQAGFRANLGVSYWGPGLSDYMLVNFHRTSFRAFDAGVLRPEGEQSYTAEAITSTYRGSSPNAVFGPFSLTAQHIFQLHEFTLLPGTYAIDLIDGGGEVDWGLSLHRGDLAVVNKYAVLTDGSAWAAAAGEDESIVVTVADSGSYCLAVWKVGSADLAKSGIYSLNVRPGTVDVDGAPAARTALVGAFPNPFTHAARVLFDLAREAEVALEVYDLHGARVRTLAAGRLSAGRHEAAWNGTDGAGLRAAQGVYFVRLKTDGVTVTRRIVKLD